MDPNPQLRNFATSVVIATNTTTAIKAPDASTDYIYVTGIILNITVHNNTGSITFEDNNGSPVICAVYSDLTVAAGANQGQSIVYDFGKRGFKLTQGKTLQAVATATIVGACVVYGYQSAS